METTKRIARAVVKYRARFLPNSLYSSNDRVLAKERRFQGKYQNKLEDFHPIQRINPAGSIL